VEKVLNYLKKININFSKYYLIDSRVNKFDAEKYIRELDVIYLLGGNPEIQMNLINEYDLKMLLQDRGGITIGVSAGAMNQAKRVVYKNEALNCNMVDYEGIGFTEILIYPHLNINSIKYLHEILEVSKYAKLYALPNDSFVRIENGKVQFIGDCYIIRNCNY